MATKREFLLIFVVSCFMISAYSRDFESLWLVQQWPPSVCSSISTYSTPCSDSYSQSDKFLIYSLWPEFNDGTFPTYCYGSDYDSNAIKNENSELEKYWPNLYGGSNDETWERAWNVHGKCAESKFNQTAYFKKALEIRTNSKYDIFKALERTGVFPTDEASISKLRVKHNIMTMIGKKPGIHCEQNEKTRVEQMTKIIFCFDKDDTYIDCPESADRYCPDSFSWPPAELFSSKLAMPTDADH